MIPDETAAQTWQILQDNLNHMRLRLDENVIEMFSTMSDAKSYFDAYVKGNQIDQDFFS
jgi:hypothetical protein